jgi:hypothetical protein
LRQQEMSERNNGAGSDEAGEKEEVQRINP